MWQFIQDKERLICIYYVEAVKLSVKDDDDEDLSASAMEIERKTPEIIDIKRIEFVLQDSVSASTKVLKTIKIKLLVFKNAPERFHKGQKVSFIKSLEEQILALENTEDTFEIESEELEDGDSTLTFTIDISHDLTFFNNVIDYLKGKMHAFPEQITQPNAKGLSPLQKLLNPSRETEVNTQENKKRRTSKRIEANADNNMFGVIVSTRISEENLRQKYNFPKPNYQQHNYEPVITLADYEEDLPKVLEEDTRWINYSYLENSMIDNLIDRIYALAQSLCADNYIYTDYSGYYYFNEIFYPLLKHYNTPDAELNDAIHKEDGENDELLAIIATSPNSIFNIKQRARLAFDLLACLRNLNNGSYSHNGLMDKTNIKGYGIRNVVALIWHACLEASHPNNKALHLKVPPAANETVEVTRSTMLEIMVRAIANGARGGNRNFVLGSNEQYTEDLKFPDSPVCGQGKFNFLFDAFNTVLHGIDLIYDVPELFIQKVKTEFYNLILNSVDVNYDLEKAKLLVKIWNGKLTQGVIIKNNSRTLNLSMRQEATFKILLKEAQQKLPTIKDQFIQDFSKGNEEFKKIIRDDLKQHIGDDKDLQNLTMLELNEMHLISAHREFMSEKSVGARSSAKNSYKYWS